MSINSYGKAKTDVAYKWCLEKGELSNSVLVSIWDFSARVALVAPSYVRLRLSSI
jgi:hypothetical protein